MFIIPQCYQQAYIISMARPWGVGGVLAGCWRGNKHGVDCQYRGTGDEGDEDDAKKENEIKKNDEKWVEEEEEGKGERGGPV